MRARAIPTNPSTELQAIVREALGRLAGYWNNMLTPAQRAGWNLYASNVTVQDVFGDAIKLSGQQHYIRSNAPRLQANLARIDDAPSVFNLGDPPTLTNVGVDVDGRTSGTNAPPGGARSLIYAGRPQSPGISYFRGPWRLLGSYTGNFTDQTYPFAPVQELQLVWFRARSTYDDGRLSEEIYLGPLEVES